MKSEVTDFEKRVSSLIGMKITHIWMGYGAHFFIELGKLSDSGYESNPNGEATITLGATWNQNHKSRVLGGSSNSYPAIDKAIKKLIGEEIINLEVLERSKELRILLSNNTAFQSVTTFTGYPNWSIKLTNGFYISIDNDVISIATGDHPGEGLGSEEKKELEFSKEVTARWGKPATGNSETECWNCNFWVRLDGPSYYLDYGVCASKDSEFDGKVTNCQSGCEHFQE